MKVNRSAPDPNSITDASRSNQADQTKQAQESQKAEPPASAITQQATPGGVGSVEDRFEKAEPPSYLDKALGFAKIAETSDLPNTTGVTHIVQPEDLPRSPELGQLLGPNDLPPSPEVAHIIQPEDLPRSSEEGQLLGPNDLPPSPEVAHIIEPEDLPRSSEESQLLGPNDLPRSPEADQIFGPMDHPRTADQFYFNQEGHLVIKNKAIAERLKSQLSQQLGKPVGLNGIRNENATSPLHLQSPEQVLIRLKLSALSVNQDGHLVIGDREASTELKSGLDQGRTLEEMLLI